MLDSKTAAHVVRKLGLGKAVKKTESSLHEYRQVLKMMGLA